MFRLVLVSALVLAVAVSASPIGESGASTEPAVIISQEDNSNPDGSFNNRFETSNGIKVESNGILKKVLVPEHQDSDGQVIPQHEEDVLVQTGSYSFTDSDGQVYTLTYVADENGFQPQGDHLPQAPQPQRK